MSGLTVIAGLAGLVWGALGGLINVSIMKKAIGKENNNAVMGGNLARTVVDLVFLGLVFLLSGLLPFPYEPMLIGTAISLSVVSIAFAFRFGKK